MKKIFVFTAIFALLLVAACGNDAQEGGENGESAEAADAGTEQMQAANEATEVSYDEVVAKFGEDEVKSMYIEIMAHSKAALFSSLADTEKLMEMTPEERTAYAVEKGKKTAAAINKARSGAGLTPMQWKAIADYANENDWYTDLAAEIKSRQDELEAEMENAEGEEQ